MERKSCWASIDTDTKPRQKRCLVPMGSGIAGSKVCPVCVELNPSAANVPLPCEIAPKLLSSSDLVASMLPSW